MLKYVTVCILGIVIGCVFTCQQNEIERQTQEAMVIDSLNFVWRTNHFSFSEENVMNEIMAQELDYPEVVLAQAIVETGGFHSTSCTKDNNLFGLRRKDGTYMKFLHWSESVSYYKEHIQSYKEKPSDYFKFLNDLGYAENKSYTDVIKPLSEKLKAKFLVKK